MSLRNLRCDEVDFLLERDFPPSQVLELAIASELMRGAESPFYGYLQVLPHHPGEDIPLLWDDEHLNSLAGTGLDIAARKRRQRLEGIYTEMMAALASDDAMHSSRFAKVTFEALMAAASLTSSRCMYVDDRHGYALVPAADAMNHKCALAPERGHSAGEDEGEEEGEDVEDDEAEKCNSGMADEHGDSQIDRVPDHRFVGASRRAVREAAQGLGLDLTMEASFANLEKRPFQWDSTDEEEDEEEEDSEEEEEDEEQGPRPSSPMHGGINVRPPPRRRGALYLRRVGQLKASRTRRVHAAGEPADNMRPQLSLHTDSTRTASWRKGAGRT